jgi:hypothetical protein
LFVGEAACFVASALEQIYRRAQRLGGQMAGRRLERRMPESLAHPLGFVLCLALMVLAWWLWNRFMDR